TTTCDTLCSPPTMAEHVTPAVSTSPRCPRTVWLDTETSLPCWTCRPARRCGIPVLSLSTTCGGTSPFSSIACCCCTGTRSLKVEPSWRWTSKAARSDGGSTRCYAPTRSAWTPTTFTHCAG